MCLCELHVHEAADLDKLIGSSTIINYTMSRYMLLLQANIYAT